jgi:predicted nucleotidyltransferase
MPDGGMLLHLAEFCGMVTRGQTAHHCHSAEKRSGPARARRAHAALFGSHARGDKLPGSDIDIMIEIDPDVLVDLFGYIAIKQYLADFFRTASMWPTAVD